METPIQMDIKIEDEEFVCPDPPNSQDTKNCAKDYYGINEFNTNCFDFDDSADDDDEENECALCEKVFQSKKLFKVHLKQHGKLDGWLSDSVEEEEFQSIEKPETETMDLQSIALNKNKSTKSDEKLYQCQLCPKVFSYKSEHEKVDEENQIDEKSERYHVNDGAKSQSLNSLMQVKPAKESREQAEKIERKRALARERSRRYRYKKSLSISKSGLLAANETPSQEFDEEYQYRAEQRRALARERTRRCRNKKSLSASKSGLLAANKTQIPGPSQENSPHVIRNHDSQIEKTSPNRRHEREYTENVIKCQECPKTFTTQSDYKIHRRVHAGDRYYKCRQCPKTFSTKKYLSLHNRQIHTEHPFKCDLCPKTYPYSYNLKVHMRNHTNERPFKCSECPATFFRNNDLTRHMYNHNGNHPYQCEICSKKCSELGQFETHMRVHTGERPYKCDKCDKLFQCARSIRRHSLKHERT